MSKLSKSLLKGAEEALQYAHSKAKGFKTHKIKVPKAVDVGLIRNKLHMTRQEFAQHFGFSIRTLEKWEQGVRQPESSARAYLVVIARNPEAVETALAS